MIITITLNPAVDKTLSIDNFQTGGVNRESGVRIDAGGKGINVSKVIQELEGRSKAMGILAGRTGNFIKNELDRMGINNDFMMIPGETRTNIKVVDSINHLTTDINENGPSVLKEDLKVLEDKVIQNLNKDTIVVFSGSAPGKVDKQIYKRLIAEAKLKGAKTILDADGELLLEGLEAGPYLVKPNVDELERIFCCPIKSKKEVIEYGRKILGFGVNYVVVSLGGEGSVFITHGKAAIVDGIKVDVQSTVGAGDAMVGALALAIDKNYSFEETIKLAVAASTASVMMGGTQSGKLEDITKLMEKVTFDLIGEDDDQ